MNVIFSGKRAEMTMFFLHLKDDETVYDLIEHKEKRSLNSNAYFHRLVGLLAKGEKTKFYEKKNELIMQYGNHEFIRDKEGKPKYVLLKDDEEYKSDSLYHYYPTQFVDEFRGIKMRAFVMFQGTHEYDSKAMAHLIECTRNECLGCDIPMSEIETPEEKAMFAELQRKAKENGKRKEV